MRFCGGTCRPVLVGILALLYAGACSAATLSYSGTITSDDDVALFSIYLSSPGHVTLQTWSFAGGVNAEGEEVPAGGFFPYLTMFDVTGQILYTSNQLLISNYENICGGCNYDPVAYDYLGAHYYYDAYISTDPLPAGWYTVALTVYDNTPVGMNWSDGLTHSYQNDPFPFYPHSVFTQQYQNDTNSRIPYYDPVNGVLQDAPFLLYSSGEKRTGDWELDITGVDSSAQLPEPASLALAAMGLVLLLAPRALGARRVL